MRKIRRTAGGAVLLLVLLLAWDVGTPQRVAWVPARWQGLDGARADGLVLQHEAAGTVWASRGWSVYRSRNGGDFERVFTLRPRFGEPWAAASRTLRRLFGYQELVEVVPLRDDLLVVFGGGDAWRVDLVAGTQEHVHALRYFGRGKGRGVMPFGVTSTPDGDIYYGEYPTESDGPGTVRVWRSRDEGRHFETAFEFLPGEVRHIHNVQWDPFSASLWMGTGDADTRSMIGSSRDGARHFEWIGRGSQLFRVVSLVFLPDAVAWATDADTTPPSMLRWRRDQQIVEPLPGSLPAPTFYAQAIDEHHALLGLAEHDASLWTWEPGRPPRRLAQWTLPATRRGPHPAVRLARRAPGACGAGDMMYVNPLRTVEEEAAIWRIPTRYALDAAGREEPAQ